MKNHALSFITEVAIPLVILVGAIMLMAVAIITLTNQSPQEEIEEKVFQYNHCISLGLPPDHCAMIISGLNNEVEIE